MNDVLEFLYKKKGYDPKIGYSIYEEESKRNSQEILSYDKKEIKERVFYRMCQIFPKNSFKSFIQKFITTSNDIFVFRKQFATSYDLNSILGYIVLELIKLNNISFNKETVSCAFNDIQYLYFEDREMDQIRFTKNISFFLTSHCLYGIIPTVINSTLSAVINKSELIETILFCVVFNNYRNDLIVDEIQKFINIFLGNQIFKNCKDEEKNNYEDGIFIWKSNDEYPLKVIFQIIENSINDNNLRILSF